MDALLDRGLFDILDRPQGATRDAYYLVVRDGIGQILNEPFQGVGMVYILQEPQEAVLLRQRSELYDNPSQFPVNNRFGLAEGPASHSGRGLTSAELPSAPSPHCLDCPPVP